MAGPCHAQTYTFTTINHPNGSAGTVARSINDAGLIVGGFHNGSLEGAYSYSAGAFTTLALPGFGQGLAVGVNNLGQIVGGAGTWPYEQGFLLDGNSFSTHLYSGSYQTIFSAINDAGVIVGVAWDIGGIVTNTNFSTETVLKCQGLDTTPTAVNNSGQIAGYYYPSGYTRGFVWSGGSCSTIHVPGAVHTYLVNINDVGQLIGSYIDALGTWHGFLFSDGKYTPFEFPGATRSGPIGINNKGQIVGSYIAIDGYEHGYLATPTQPADKTAPIVTVTGVSNGAVYTPGSVPAAGCSTTDSESGVAKEATLTLTGGTPNGVGSFTATCSGAKDNAGNLAAPVSVTYSVQYGFIGFLAPVSMTAVNTVKAGQSIPLKWQLLDSNSSQIVNLSTVAGISTAGMQCAGGITGAELPADFSGNSGLRYDPTDRQFVFTWKTDKSWAGSCQLVTLRLDDGSSHAAGFVMK
jgi:hypothetical protein